MSGLGRVVVGYRKGDRQIQRLKDEHGLNAVPVKVCAAGCGYPVYFVQSGVDAYRSRDPEVMCDVCYAAYKDQVVAELQMTALDRLLSVLVIVAAVTALYLVWLHQGELDNMDARLDRLTDKVDAFPRENAKPAAARKKTET